MAFVFLELNASKIACLIAFLLLSAAGQTGHWVWVNEHHVIDVRTCGQVNTVVVTTLLKVHTTVTYVVQNIVTILLYVVAYSP